MLTPGRTANKAGRFLFLKPFLPVSYHRFLPLPCIVSRLLLYQQPSASYHISNGFCPFDIMPTLLYNRGMKHKPYTVLRIRESTHKQLRLIAALSDERMIDTIDRLAAQELSRLQAQFPPEQAREKT